MGRVRRMSPVFSEACRAAVLGDQIEVRRQVRGLRPDPFSGREPVRTQPVAKPGFASDPIDGADQAIDVFEDESTATLRHQFGQSAQVADRKSVV